MLALLRGRGHVTGDDIRDLAADVLRHRIVLSYDALSEGVTADDLLERVLDAVARPGLRAPDPRAPAADQGGQLRSGPVAATLAPPAARQGPGPLPQALIDALDVAVNRLVTRTLPGDRRAVGVGIGTELAQLRPYEFGDDVRHIDPAASARTGQPHVRLHVPERALTTWIVLDVSPSMAFGTARRLKADIAEGVALVFGRLGIRRAGSVGFVSFGSEEPRVLQPRGSKPGMVALRRALEAGVAPDGEHDPEGLAGALQPRRPALAPTGARGRDLRLPRAAHLGAGRSGRCGCATPMLAVEVVDPREAELPAAGVLALVDPETGARVEVDTSRRRVRERFAELESERRGTIARELRRLRTNHVVLSTDEDWLLGLGRYLR